MSLLLSQAGPPYDPANGFPWPQPVVPIAQSVKPRCTALLLSACAFVYVPPPFDPGATGFPYPQTVELPRGLRRAEGLRPSIFKPPDQFGTAVRFVGAAQNNGLAITANLPGPTNFSVAALFYVPAIPGPDSSIWMLQDTNGTSPGSYINAELSGGNLAVAWTGGGFQSLGAITAGGWYYVVVSIGGAGSGSAYWGKVGAAPSTVALGPGLPTTLVPASFTVDTDYFTEPLDGRICSVRVWNVALSAGEAAAEAQQFAPKRTANLQQWWKLEHASTKLVDSSGFGRDLTAIGAGSWTDEEGPFFQPGPFDSQFGPFEQLPELARVVRRVTTAPTIAFVPLVTAAAQVSLDWLPWFEQPQRRRDARPEGANALVQLVAAQTVQLDWLPVFPQQLQRRASPPMGGMALPLARQPDVDWLSPFPDFARGLRRPLNVGGPAPTSYARQPDVDWLPVLADFARGPRRALVTGGMAPESLARQPAIDWWSIFPDFARAARRPLNAGGAAPLVRRQPEVDVEWLPQLPALMFRARAPAQLGGAAFVPIVFTPALTQWAAVFPDLIARPVLRPLGGEVHPLLVVVIPAPLLPLWAPSFPVFAPRGRELWASLRATFRISDFTLNTFEGGYTRAVNDGSATSAQTSAATKAELDSNGKTTAETGGHTSAEVIK